MIYLITGSPGTGKTSKVVSMILNNEDGLFTYVAEDGTKLQRPLYFCHIDGLDVKKFKANELTEEELKSKPLRDLVPTGSVVIVDEADYTYPVRAAGRPVPEYIQTLKELRHEGFTLILMTQHPSMIDVYIRNLVGKHIHLQRLQIGQKQYEFLNCETNLSIQSLKAADVSSFYKPDKRAFKYYKSATMHVKFKRKLHWVFYALPVLLVFLFFMVSSFLSKVNNSGSEQVDVQASAPAPASVSASASASDVPASSIAASAVPEFSAAYYEPRVPDMPETAPVYDSVRKVAVFEYPVGCVQSQNSCNCYSEQGSLIKSMSKAACKDFIKNGHFNPYKKPEPQKQQVQQRVRSESAGGQVAVMGGDSPQNLMYDGYVEAGKEFRQRGGVVGGGS